MDNQDMEMQEEFGSDIVTVVDEDGKEHVFEELDRVENEKGKYVALLPIYETDDEILDNDGEFLILKVVEEDGENYLMPIEDDAEFEEIGTIFEERLIDAFELEEADEEE